MKAKYAFQVGAVTLTLIGLAWLVSVSLTATGGHLTYTLDDPYIHLAVAENILRGGYGVNIEEFSAPSSSILYPYLLAGLLALGVGNWSALILGVVGSAVTAWVLAGLLWSNTTTPRSLRSQIFAILTLPLLLLLSSVLALPMTGMEHSLHVAATVMVVAGLWQLGRDRPVPPWFLAAAILLPLLRFEGMALCVAVLAALLWYRKFLSATILVACVGGTFAVFALMLVQNGLPLLPSSVMVKSPAMAAAIGAQSDIPAFWDQIVSLLDDLQSGARHPRGEILGFAIVLFTLSAARRGLDHQRRIVVGLSLSFALLGHITVGQYGWFDRYEVYAISMLAAGLIVVFNEFWRDLNGLFFFKTVGVLCFLALVSATYLEATRDTPAASNNIWQQQYQMHRFATDFFPQTVAVNDLGYVAYQNDNFVLDLWGLGSEKARLSADQAGTRTPDVLRALTAERDVPYAMIYESWFTDAVPAEWCKIAELHTVKVSSAEPDVAFYLIDLTRMDAFNAALDAFVPTIPAPAKMERFACNAG